MNRRTLELALQTVGLACAAVVGLGYLQGALALIAYPWDWGPDEGMALDAATRIGQGLSGIYSHTLPPWPWAYGPLVPWTLALAGAAGPGLARARVVAALWVLALLLSVFVLVRWRSGTAIALCATALVLSPFFYTSFFLLLRVDGPMCALWALAAVLLLPERLGRGADRLSGPRVLAGSLLLVAATLAKATAIIHALPLVAGWWLVDRRSLTRLAAATGAIGLAAFGWLQWTTDGGFLYVNSLLGKHPLLPWQIPFLLLGFVIVNVLALALLTAALVVGARSRSGPLRDGSVLLVLGGLLAVPLLAKGGSTFHYLLPVGVALTVWLGRIAGALATQHQPWRAGIVGVLGAAALATALTRPFPLPDARARATARAFYALVHDSVTRSHGPLLALRPDYAHVIARAAARGRCRRQLLFPRQPRRARHRDRAASARALDLLGRRVGAVVLSRGGWLEAGARRRISAGGHLPAALLLRPGDLRRPSSALRGAPPADDPALGGLLAGRLGTGCLAAAAARPGSEPVES